MKTEEQSERILRFLKEGNVINPLIALSKFSCFRLSARIYDIKKRGFEIKDRMIFKEETKYKEYWFEKTNKT